MASQDLYVVNTELWQSLGQSARLNDLSNLWQEMLDCVMDQLGASGAWFKLETPLSVQLRGGDLAATTAEWLEIWADQPAPANNTASDEMGSSPADNAANWDTVHSQSYPIHGATLLCLRWSVGQDETTHGYMAFVFPEGYQVSEAERTQATVNARAAAAIAGQAFRLYRTSENLNRIRHLYEVGQAIASNLDLDQVLKQSTERVTEVLRAESSTLILVDEVRRELVFKIPAGPAEDMLREQRMPMDKGVAGWAASRGEPVIIPDVDADERWYVGMDRLTGYRTHSIMAVPLQVKGQTIGVVEVINKVDGASFTVDDLQWLSILAPLIAVAVENARLFTELRDEHDRIIAAEEKVRHELARNLHDGPAQILAAIILNIDMARRHLASGPEKMATELNFLESLAQEANQEVRDLLFSLRPVILETHGLIAALKQLVERLQAHVPYQLHLEVAQFSDDTLDLRVAGTLFVIIQEALNNIQKHAGPQNVWVRLGASSVLWVEVADDGAGFDVKHVEANYAQRGSFGLLNMRERARLIDGQTEIYSPRPGLTNGTLVRVEAPLVHSETAD
jgi:signal transduction histidine kinase